MSLPGGAVIAISGENIDGENNAKVSTGSDAYSWVNTGSFSAAFTRATVASTPLIKKLPGSSAVSFDGRSDILTCPGSAAALAFLNSTGVGDVALVIRRMATRSSAVRLFGTEGKGLGVYSTIHQAGVSVEGGYQFFLSNGTQTLVSLATQELRAPIGKISCLFVRLDGTQLKCTRNFWDWESQAFAAALVAGDAAHDLGIGSTGGNPASVDDFACVEFLDLSVWSTPLIESQLQQVEAHFDAMEAR